MTCEHLVCANCAGPVSEGRCSVCRASRERLRHESGPLISSATLVVLAALLIVGALLLAQFAA